MRHAVPPLTVALALALLLGGCAAPAPLPRAFVLGNTPPTTAGVWPQTGQRVVQVLPVLLPDYLDTRDMLIRMGPNEVDPSPTARWAERLSVGITGALTVALRARMANTDVTSFTPINPPAQQIIVNIDAFEIQPDGRCQLTAHWTVASGNGQKVEHSARGTFIEQAAPNDGAGIAAAMTRAIDKLAERIVAAP